MLLFCNRKNNIGTIHNFSINEFFFLKKYEFSLKLSTKQQKKIIYIFIYIFLNKPANFENNIFTLSCFSVLNGWSYSHDKNNFEKFDIFSVFISLIL